MAFPLSPSDKQIYKNYRFNINIGAWRKYEYYGMYPESAGLSAKDILDKNPRANVDGVYWIKPDSNPAFKVYCDMTNNSGGWTTAFKNHGGPNSTADSSFDLFNTSSTYDGLCIPKYDNGSLKTERVDNLWNYFINKKNIQILKTIRAYDFSGNELAPFVSGHDLPVPANVILDLGSNVSFNDIITASDGQQLNNQVEMFINGDSYGKTDIVNAYREDNIGFANQEDDYGQPTSNLMDGWGARHVIAYSNTTGMSAVRCQWHCWGGDEDFNIETVWSFKER